MQQNPEKSRHTKTLGASAFHLPKINLIQHMLTADLVQPQVRQGHGLTGMIQQLHDQTDVVVGLDVHAIGSSLAHRVRAQIVDVQQIPDLGHHVVELALVNMLLRPRGRRKQPFRRAFIAVALKPLLIHHQVHHHRLEVERVPLTGFLILDERVLFDGAIVIENVRLFKPQHVADPQQRCLADLKDGVVAPTRLEVVQQRVLYLLEYLIILDWQYDLPHLITPAFPSNGSFHRSVSLRHRRPADRQVQLKSSTYDSYGMPEKRTYRQLASFRFSN